MRKNFKTTALLLGLTALSGCFTRSHESDFVVMDVWRVDRQMAMEKMKPMRTVAAAPAVCRRDLFTIEEISQEIQQQEELLRGRAPVRGQWRHLNLADLPTPQANFLKTYGDQLGDLNVANSGQFSMCRDVPCIINAVYETPNGIEGQVIYLWYLKMGSLLTMKNKLYQQNSAAAGMYNGKSYSLKDYLFSRDELYAFWRLTHALPNSYKTLQDLKEIQRVPKGSKFEDMSPFTCGLAWSTGYVQLNDACLALWNDRDRGYFYEAVTHELGHQIDYHWGRRVRQTYYSQQPGWAATAGWRIKEFLNTQTNRTERQWEYTLENNKFVSSYARTSPAEHFAETLAYYRHDGEHTRKTVPAGTYQKTKEEVYDNVEYATEGLFNAFMEVSRIKMQKNIFQSTAECLERPAFRQGSVAIPQDSFSLTLNVATRTCLGERINGLVEQGVSEVKLDHVDGCRVLADSNILKRFKDELKTSYVQEMNKHIVESRASEEYFKKLKEFYQQLADTAQPIKLYISCYKNTNEEQCYREGLARLVSSILPDDLESGFKDDLTQMYWQTNDFNRIKADALKVYQDFARSEEDSVREAAGTLWKSCLERPISDNTPPTTRPWSSASGYIVSSIVNCVNGSLDEEVRNLASNLEINGVLIREQQEIRLMNDLFKPIFLSEVSTQYQRERQLEAQKIQETRTIEAPVIRRELLSDFSWISDLSAASTIERDCVNKVMGRVPLKLRFHLVRDEFLTWAQTSICAGIDRTPEMDRWLQGQTTLIQGQAYTVMLEKLENRAMRRADQCLGQYPIDTALNRIRFKNDREDCLVSAWDALIEEAWRETRASLNPRFQVDKAEVVSKVRLQSRRIQVKIFREKFGG